MTKISFTANFIMKFRKIIRIDFLTEKRSLQKINFLLAERKYYASIQKT